MREPPKYERSPRVDSPRAVYHKTGRRTIFEKPNLNPNLDLASREGHPLPSPGRVPRENRDPSARLRDRRDEHVPAGEIAPAAKRRDIIAHWERASVPDKRRTRT